ncbi:hypothetical protein TruAng_011358 [Truncatella angustata]|nr:hypothetical protein TruAng_011358 [Truncatella angustata]
MYMYMRSSLTPNPGAAVLPTRCRRRDIIQTQPQCPPAGLRRVPVALRVTCRILEPRAQAAYPVGAPALPAVLEAGILIGRALVVRAEVQAGLDGHGARLFQRAVRQRTRPGRTRDAGGLVPAPDVVVGGGRVVD